MSHRFEKCFLALNKNSIIYLRTIRFRRMTVRFGDSRLIVTFPNKERVYDEEYMRYDKAYESIVIKLF